MICQNWRGKISQQAVSKPTTGTEASCDFASASAKTEELVVANAYKLYRLGGQTNL
jgi:hypothetical protein